MSKIDQKKREKKEALLLSAFELFTEKGIQNTSISEIVKRAKMAKGTFYLYFKDKFDIRDQLIARQASALFDRANEELKLNDESNWVSLEECIVALATHIVDQLNESPVLLRFISKNLSWGVFFKYSYCRYVQSELHGYLRGAARAVRAQISTAEFNDLYDC